MSATVVFFFGRVSVNMMIMMTMALMIVMMGNNTPTENIHFVCASKQVCMYVL